jgi:hypothetical protein
MEDDMTQITELIDKVQDSTTVKRVYGEPIIQEPQRRLPAEAASVPSKRHDAGRGPRSPEQSRRIGKCL